MTPRPAVADRTVPIGGLLNVSHGGVTPYLKAITFALAVACLVAPSAIGIGSVDDPAASGTLALLLICTAFVAVAVLGLSAASPLTTTPLRWLLALPVLGLATSPLATNFTAAVVGASVHLSMGLAVGACVVVLGRHDTVLVLAAAMITVLCGSIIVAMWGPTEAQELFSVDPGLVGLGKFRGLLEDPNQAGRLGAAALVLCAGNWKAPQYRRLYRFGAALSAGVLVASQSRSAWIAVLAAAFAWALCTKKWLFVVSVALVVSLGAIVTSSAFDSVDATVLQREDAVGEVQTLTGRTDVWIEASRAATSRPLLGYGFNAGSAPLQEAFWMGDIRFPAGHAHSLLIQTLLTQGTVGLAVLAIALASIASSVRRTGPIAVALMTLVVVGTLTESLFVGRPGPYFIVLALCASMSTPASREAITHPLWQRRGEIGRPIAK